MKSGMGLGKTGVAKQTVGQRRGGLSVFIKNCDGGAFETTIGTVALHGVFNGCG